MKTLTFLRRERVLFWLMFVIGIITCTVDGINHTSRYGWLHPISIGGAILGGVALILGANVLFRGPLSDQSSLLGLLGIIAVKVILARLYALPL